MVTLEGIKGSREETTEVRSRMVITTTLHRRRIKLELGWKANDLVTKT